jgi:endonuclease G
MKFISLLLLVISSAALADCPHLYPYNTPIVIPGAVELCNEQYVSLYDARNRAVLLVSELVEAEPHNTPRVGTFRKDVRVPNSPSATEYNYSGYDRGHMAPADDATNPTQMRQSMLTTNLTPQDPKLNEGRWKSLEMRTRKQIEKSGNDTHVVTAAVYRDRTPMGTIPVPFGYVKAAYFQTGTVVHYTLNNSTDKTQKIDVPWANRLVQYAKIPE